MAALVVPNPSMAQEPPEPPQGQTFGYEMIFDAGKSRAWANDAADMLDALSPGYLNADAAERLRARYRLATHVIAITQGLLLADHIGDLQADPTLSAAFATGGGQPDITVWASPIPLIVLDLHYAPFTERLRPEATAAGNLLWFQAYDEEEMLTSLHQSGFISLARHGS
jgi:hypothetical protein